MVASDCLASVDICAMRVCQLNATGSTLSGNVGYFTTNVDTCKMGTTDNSIAQVISRNGCGTIVTTIPAQPAVDGSAFSIDLLAWERDLIHLLVGGTTFVTSGHTAGWQAAKLLDGVPLPCCIEVWSKEWTGGVQAITAQSTPHAGYHHWVLPFVLCSLSTQFTLATGDTLFTITGVGSENPNMRADGPYDDWPAWVVNHGGVTSALGEYDDGTIPTGACGLQNVPVVS